ncbi:hypothetical protein HRUBRA_00174 [Pseudohaliea rubra DSM 19751]|uniref:BLUF domain-containing protein n=2 Tax=Pseudohaliea TaxID=1341120 RepID=A0A095X2Y4_9GAMM|nr:hypothetical protein HRUBRA_00174 [Pseudohaliea rubra DSM 19751]
MPADELLQLLESARAYNGARDVTGVLLHRDNSFFQVLEGTESDVRAIFSRVNSDPRHERLEVLFDEPAQEREFADWRMGFLELDGVDVTAVEGVSDFLTRDLDPRELFTRLSRAKRLMLLFRQMC